MAKKGKCVLFRDEERIVNLVDKVANNKGIDRSDFIREAIRKRLADLSFFSEEVKKSLGVKKVRIE